MAAIGTWAVTYGATASPGDRYLVASRPIGPGQRIGTADLSWSTLELSAATRAGAFVDQRALAGTVALGPIEPGELLQAGAVAPAAGTADEGEVSFAVEAEWAVAGSLQAGDRIDVFATTEASSGATSRRVLEGAVVRNITSTGGDGLGESRRQVVTVAVRRGDEVEAVVTAARAAT
ncbi:MAG TPA: SAF domain-containing protein, partial [Aquihabitans sp.]|nr:SAF domain-containing protein [Aquihabitans sp.]